MQLEENSQAKRPAKVVKINQITKLNSTIMANYNEIINSKEYFMTNGEERMVGITVHITEEGKFLCIMQETAPKDGYRVCMQVVDLLGTYREMRTWLENVQWYTNGNQYDNSEYKE